MKTTFVICLILSITVFQVEANMEIAIGHRIKSGHSDAYPILCEGAIGAPTYKIDGLPKGAKFDGDKIMLSQ